MVQNPTIPSAVGTIDGSSRLRWASGESSPSTLADIADRLPIATTMDSYIDRSITAPPPPPRAWRTAAAATTAANVPANHSPRRPPACKGSEPGQPRLAIEPHNAWRMNSLAIICWSTYGPVVPNGVIATTTVDDPASAVTSCRDLPSVRSVSTRSAPATYSARRASSQEMTDLLLAARYPNRAPGLSPADHRRIGSPCGGSILTMSAPASANIFP